MYIFTQKVTVKTFLLGVFTSTLLASCQSSWRQPIPDGSIVFMAGYSELGFVQPDGTGNQIIELRKRLARPVWSNDGNIIYGLSGSGQAGAYGGHPAFWDLETGRYKICSKGLPFFTQIQELANGENSYEVIVQNNGVIVAIDLDKCNNTQTFVDYSEHPGEYAIAGFSYSPKTNELVYGLVINPYKEREYQLIHMDINTGEHVQLGDGINPSWSPDRSQIAYIGLDGLYVLSLDKQEGIRLVNQPFFSPWSGGSAWDLVTTPRWSPDGEWLIYHRCDSDKLCMTADAHIYKIPSTGGEEVLVHSGGEYPSWGNR
jgi:tricorn protease-like protein